MFGLLTFLLVPKIYNDYERHQPGYEEKNNLRNRLLLGVHDVDLGNNLSIYASVQKYIFIWTQRFLQFPESQPKTWYVCFLFLLGLLVLPWFRAEFIPSGKDQTESMGYFYLWGLLFERNQWVSVDTWIYVIFQLTFSVGFFILILVWKSTPAELMHCKGIDKAHKAHLCDWLLFQVLVLVFWGWRFLDLCELGTFYGGYYPTVIFNLLTWWLLFVGAIKVSDAIMAFMIWKARQGGANPLATSSSFLDICGACRQAMDEPNDTSNYRTSEERIIIQEDSTGSDSSSSDSHRRAFRRVASKKD